MSTLEEVLAFRQSMFDKSYALIAKKGLDYNRDQQAGGDTLFNLRVAEMLGIVPTAERGILVRLADKLMRLISLMDVDREAAVSDESLDDTVADIHNYVDYALLMRKERLGQKLNNKAKAIEAVDTKTADDFKCDNCDSSLFLNSTHTCPDGTCYAVGDNWVIFKWRSSPNDFNYTKPDDFRCTNCRGKIMRNSIHYCPDGTTYTIDGDWKSSLVLGSVCGCGKPFAECVCATSGCGDPDCGCYEK